ncbi:endonuclease V [Candidatus Woesearchaeota archaeon]|nr:endonuclease V [Candidatus Woesearchaeota archaeon]
MNIQELKKEQLRLAKKVVTKDDFDEINYIAGCDQAYLDGKVVSCIVVMEYKTLKVVEKRYAAADAPLQYIPGFLAYRESPAVIEAMSKVEQKPDILLVDGNGVLHPRRLGMASHLGILLDMPTIGVAKKLMLGEEKDSKIMLEGERLGTVLKTKEHAKPIFLSVGHRVSLKTAEEIVRKCMVEKHKMPEPIHEAHKYSNKVRTRMLAETGAKDSINDSQEEKGEE